MNFKDTWKAEWENGILHISGTTDLFPNEFSTSSLERVEAGNILSYKIIFNRDKEPFCSKELVGSVNYFENNIPTKAKSLKILGNANEYVEIQIPAKP